MSSNGANGSGGAATEADNDGFTYCVGSPTWNPARYAADTELQARAAAHLEKDDFYSAIAESFSLRPKPTTTTASATAARGGGGGGGDTYVYHAIISLTLAQAQRAVSLGGADDLHAWYRDPSTGSGSEEENRPHPSPPPRADVDAYLSVFDPLTATAAALRSFGANARRGSVRRRVAEHLSAKRFLHPALPELEIPKVKKPKSNSGAGDGGEKKKQQNPPPNPYLAFASWASRNLEWCGPCDLSEAAPGGGHRGHPVLPILMHHFGCACPSHEALEILRVLAAGRGVVDAGSGNGYWTFCLRARGVAGVVPVDSGQSAWRATWVRDTARADAAAWLRRPQNRGGEDKVLLVVYPIVGGGAAGGEEGGFTRGLLRAYKGDTFAVVGTQNRNGYTGFPGRAVDEYMRAEEPEWVKVVQVPLPSFPGKDDALFVFQRGQRAERLRSKGGGEGN